MRSIGRERELAALMQEVSRRIDDDGQLVERGLGGRQVHISVSAPHLGGLSLFLEDVRAALDTRKGVLPILQILERPNDPDADFEPVLKKLAEQVGGSLTGGGVSALFGACEAVWASRGLLPVLILDASAALDQIESVEALRHAAMKSPLLQRLRILGTAMEDQEPKLVVIVGWHDNFPALSSGWRAQDIVQRFFPSFVLWPDFQQDNPWPIFRQILERSFEVTDDYPGFCRSGVPVGAVIARAKEKKKSKIDGLLLCELLRSEGEIPTDVRNLDAGTVIALCLQDAQIGEGHPFVAHVRSPAFRPYVEVTEDGYVANEDLYAALGLRPRHVIVARDRQIRNRFEEADLKLGEELASALPSVFNAAGEVSSRDTYQVCEFEPLPHWSEGRPVRVTAFVSLGRTVPSELRAEIVNRLKAIEADPVARCRDVLLFMHRDPGLGSQLTRSVLAEAEAFEPRTFAVREGRTNVQKAVALASVEIDVDHVIEGIVAKFDPNRGAKRVRDHLLGAVRKQFRLASESFPSFSKSTFESAALPLLIGDSRRWRRPGEGIPPKDADALVSLKVLTRQESDDAVRWSFSEDGFLASVLGAIKSGSSLREHLSERYLYDVESWPSIAPAIASAWCDYLALDRGELKARDPVVALSRRVAALEQSVESALARLETFGSVPEYAEIEQDLKRLTANRKGASEVELERICDGIIGLERQASSAIETWQSKREESRQALAVAAEKLKKVRARDPATDAKRITMLGIAEKMVASEDGAYNDLRARLTEIDSLLQEIEAADRQRDANARASQRVRQQATQLEQRAEKLGRRVEGLVERAGHEKLKTDLGAIQTALSEIGRVLSAEEGRDEVPAERGQLLGKLNSQLAQLEFTLSDLTERVTRLERTPTSTRPPTVQGPAEPSALPRPVVAPRPANPEPPPAQPGTPRAGDNRLPRRAADADPIHQPEDAQPRETRPTGERREDWPPPAARPPPQAPMKPVAEAQPPIEQTGPTPPPTPVASQQELIYTNSPEDLDRLAEVLAMDIRVLRAKVER